MCRPLISIYLKKQFSNGQLLRGGIFIVIELIPLCTQWTYLTLNHTCTHHTTHKEEEKGQEAYTSHSEFINMLVGKGMATGPILIGISFMEYKDFYTPVNLSP